MLFKLESFEWRVAIGLAAVLPVALGVLFACLRWRKKGSPDFAGALAVTFSYLVSFLLLAFFSFLRFEFERFQTGAKQLSHHVQWATGHVILFFLPLPAAIVFALLTLLFWTTPVRLPFMFISLFFLALHFINLAHIVSGGDGYLTGI